MKYPISETFENQGKKFEITTTAKETKFQVVATLNDVQVSPTYSVDLTTNQDYFFQYRQSITERLVEIAKSDIRDGIYYKA